MLDLFLARGVVGTRDMGGNAEIILPLRDPVFVLALGSSVMVHLLDGCQE